jgi:hypothetical protein
MSKGPFRLLHSALKLKPSPTGQRTNFSSLPTRTLCTFQKHQYSAATTATRSQSGSRTGIIYCRDKLNRHISLCISSPPSSIISPLHGSFSRGRTQMHNQLSSHLKQQSSKKQSRHVDHGPFLCNSCSFDRTQENLNCILPAWPAE